jgi:FkbM family methyltransferase
VQNFGNQIRNFFILFGQQIRTNAFWFLVRHNYLFRSWSFLARKKKSFAVNEIDLLISQLFSEVESPKYYIEIGANDGVSQSNTKYLELYDGWKGLLVEPIPHLYKKLIKNRSKSNTFVNSACCSFKYSTGQMTFLYSGLMSLSLEGESDIQNRKQHIEDGKGHLAKNEFVFELRVPTTPLNSILLDSEAPKQINFFSLDVEGSELEVLKGINFNEFSFDYICVESRSFSQVKRFLEDRGYKFLLQLTNSPTHSDYLFKSQSL